MLKRSLLSLALLQIKLAVALDTGDQLEDALADDDQCDGDSAVCALSALQLRGNGLFTDLLQEDEEERDIDTGSGDDISISAERALLADAVSQQKVIRKIWVDVAALKKQVNASMSEVEAACGFKVVWDTKFGGLLETGEEALAGRRRKNHRQAKVEKTFRYLEKEMTVVYANLNVVDRMNAGIGTLMLVHPSPGVVKELPKKGGELSQLASSLSADDEEQSDTGVADIKDVLEARLNSIIGEIDRAKKSLSSVKEHVRGIRETIDGWLPRWKAS